MKRTFIAVFAFCMCLFGFKSDAKIYVAEPYLVEQPSYAGLEFYVYRPYGVPEGWYLTFDGFAVTKTNADIWVYGTIQGGAPVLTNYIVGSVNPGLAGIIPYYGPGEISSTLNLPKQGTIAKQPVGPAPNQTAKQVYLPQWAVDPAFMAIRNWRGSVDRIGVIQPTGIPIAWKGEYPNVVFAWTGNGWYQINRKESEQLVQALRSNLYVLVKAKTKSNFNWYREDSILLTQKTIDWGYYWMGEISVK